MAKPLGDPVTVVSAATTNRYVWNADGVIPSMDPGRTIDVARLPSTATETAYSQGDDRLWVDSEDPSVLYVVSGDTARVFARDLQAGLCA